MQDTAAVPMRSYYHVPLLTYSASNIGVTSKCGLGVVEGRRKWCQSIDTTYYWSVCHSKYSSILSYFQLYTLKNIVTLKSRLRVIENSTI